MLEVTHLTKRFGDIVAVDDLSMTVEAGRMHGFVGRNGAGKTTTMRIVLGLLAADAGDIRFRSRAITTEDRRRIGYIPEERGLYPRMTAREQVELLGDLTGIDRRRLADEAERVLSALGIADRADEPIQGLSLGNQQRAQLAVALVGSPDLLVLDEPFSGLDPVGVDALADVLRQEVQRGTAVLFSSHQLDLVERLCDEVTIIERGRLVATGSILDLRARWDRKLLRVALEGGWTSWADGLPDARMLAVEGDEVVLELRPGGDDQIVLDAARKAGRVRLFRHEDLRLVDVFREVVQR